MCQILLFDRAFTGSLPPLGIFSKRMPVSVPAPAPCPGPDVDAVEQSFPPPPQISLTFALRSLSFRVSCLLDMCFPKSNPFSYSPHASLIPVRKMQENFLQYSQPYPLSPVFFFFDPRYGPYIPGIKAPTCHKLLLLPFPPPGRVLCTRQC